MNQQSVVLGVAPNMRNGFGGLARSSSTNHNNRGNAVQVFINSDVQSHSTLLRSTKNTPVITAATLEEISLQNLSVNQVEYANQSGSAIKSVNVATGATVTKDSVADVSKTTRHLTNLEKLSSQPIALANQTASTTALLKPEAFGFGVEARSLIGKLEAAKEVVTQELALSEENAKVHANITLQMPFTPHSMVVIEESVSSEETNSDSTNFAIEQKQSLVFEAQTGPVARGGLARAHPITPTHTPDFEVSLASYATPSSITPAINQQQKIADNLTSTSTTVVSGLEITLNPNAAVKRQTPAEQQAFLWPLPTRGRLTSGYGNRTLAITNNHFHQGIDIAVKTGTPILSVKDGVVEKAGWEGSYGYAVYVRHNDGTEARYAHMSRIIVEKGEWVNQGQWLGLVGSTGLSTGPHLHFELHLSGQAVDPSKHLVYSGERLASR